MKLEFNQKYRNWTHSDFIFKPKDILKITNVIKLIYFDIAEIPLQTLLVLQLLRSGSLLETFQSAIYR